MSLLTCDYAPSVALWVTDAQRILSELPRATAQAVRESMDEVGRILDSTVPVDTGALRSNRSPVTQDGPGTFSTGYDLPYAGVLEYGGYPGVGPKTIALGGMQLSEDFDAGGGIYSQQAPWGWMRKALASVKAQFHQRVLAAMVQTWGRTATAGPLRGNLQNIFDIDIV